MKNVTRLRDLAVIKLRLHYDLMTIVEKEYLEAYHYRQAVRQLYQRQGYREEP